MLNFSPAPNSEHLNAAVLAPSKTVNRDAHVSADSSFEDAVWRMHSMTHATSKHKYWDFRTVPGFPGGFSLSVAEYAFHRLYKPVATHDREGMWPTIHNELVCLRQFAHFCAEAGCENFGDVEPHIYDEFYSSLGLHETEAAKSADRKHKLITIVYRLWEYRSVITTPLESLPFNRPKDVFLGRRHNSSLENRTPAIPEPVYASLTSAALDYVLLYAKQILEAYKKLQEAWSEISSTTLSKGGKTKRLANFAAHALSQISCPWRKTSWCSQDDLYQELSQLRSACMIVIVAFSGIRTSELLAIEAGCCVSDTLPNGQVRYYINTILRKHRGLVGSKDTWVVIEEVVKAIEILEFLTVEIRQASASRMLFLSTGTNASFTVTGVVGPASRVSVSGTLLWRLNVFLRVANEILDRPPIPQWISADGVLADWRLNLMQFRRTLARHIARQPFGIIAGMRQYKHVETTCFEGYAGSDPDWNKLLEEEKVLASIDLLGELSMDMAAGVVSGKRGMELKKAFESEFQGRAEDFPASQIAKWLANQEKQLFVGKFNFCFFNDEKALCTKDAARKDVPIVNACDPTHCSNSCVTKKHAPLWEAQMQQATQLMGHPRSTELQKIALKGQIFELQSVLSSL